LGAAEEAESNCRGHGANHSCRGNQSSLARVHGAQKYENQHELDLGEDAVSGFKMSNEL